jgi:hypothetical protein
VPGRRFAIAVVVILGALVLATGAQACSCAELTPRAALRQADAAVVARLVRVDPIDRWGADYLYLVRRVYKGGRGLHAGEKVSIRSGVNGASCGLPDDRVRWYGLFLSRREHRWRGGLCGLAAPSELAAAAEETHRGDDLTALAATMGCA